MGSSETFDIAGPSGRLEAVLMRPEGDPIAAAVVCHAHPLHGGMMHFKPVFRAAQALQSAGIAALRFNFRGVGRSEGTHDNGRGEQEDARAALDVLDQRYAALPLMVGGFSFGSVVALRVACRDRRVRAAFALGFPASMTIENDFLKTCTLPRLFIQGGCDTLGDPDRVRSLVAQLPPRCSLHVIEGSDHFFEGHLEELHDALRAWAQTRPWA